MRIIKKTTALILTAVICLSFSGLIAADEKEHSYYLLRSENFTLPADGGWSVQTNAANYENAIPGNYLKDSAWQGPGASTTIYVTEESDYMVWVMMLGFDGESETRYAKVTIDSSTDAADFKSTVVNGWMWAKGKTAFHLLPGMHTVTVTTGFPSNMLAAVFITDDLELTLDAETTPYDDIAQYADQEAPTFDGVIDIEKKGSSAVVVTFPNAVDNIGIAGKNYYLNDEEIMPDENGVYTVEKLMPLSEYVFKQTAYDSLGNIAEISEAIKLYDWKITNRTLTDMTTNSEIGSLAEISESTDSVKISLNVEKYISGMARTPIAVGVYSKEENRMVYFTVGNVLAFGNTASPSVTIPLPTEVKAAPQNYVVKAVLIDDMDNISPISNMVAIGGTEVAE